MHYAVGDVKKLLLLYVYDDIIVIQERLTDIAEENWLINICCNALLERKQNKVELRTATIARDGPRIRAAVDRWHFEVNDEDFVEAKSVLVEYSSAAGELLSCSISSARAPLDSIPSSY